MTPKLRKTKPTVSSPTPTSSLSDDDTRSVRSLQLTIVSRPKPQELQHRISATEFYRSVFDRLLELSEDQALKIETVKAPPGQQHLYLSSKGVQQLLTRFSRKWIMPITVQREAETVLYVWLNTDREAEEKAPGIATAGNEPR